MEPIFLTNPTVESMRKTLKLQAMDVSSLYRSQYLFVDLDVGCPGRYHDTTCTKNSNAWTQLHVDTETWLGRDGIALTDSAWGGGSSLVMCPYTVCDGETVAQQWFNFVHSSTRFFVEETFGRWKSRFRFLLKPIEF
jgi:hypothetical protein